MSEYNHKEYIEKNRRKRPDELIGKQFVLLRNGNHGRMMHAGIFYTLLAYDENADCPWTFTSDYGRDVPYSITDETFRNDMQRNSYWEDY